MSPAAAQITIVVPVWGAHVAYLGDAVGSLLAQDGPPLRIVVVDNASDAPVPAPAPGVEVVRTPQRVGIGAARNAGLREAGTPYVMFWDADDLMRPGALRTLHGVLEADPGVVAATLDSLQWTPETGAGERWPWPRPVMYRLCAHPRAFALVAMLFNPFTTTGPALMRTAAVRDAGGFAEDIAFYEDWALSMSLTVRGRVAMLRGIGRLYRVHEDSLSLDHLGHADQGAWLAGLRRRVRRDHAAPPWLKAALPLVRAQHVWRERRRKRASAGAGFYESALDEVAAAPERRIQNEPG